MLIRRFIINSLRPTNSVQLCEASKLATPHIPIAVSLSHVYFYQHTSATTETDHSHKFCPRIYISIYFFTQPQQYCITIIIIIITILFTLQILYSFFCRAFL